MRRFALILGLLASAARGLAAQAAAEPEHHVSFSDGTEDFEFGFGFTSRGVGDILARGRHIDYSSGSLTAFARLTHIYERYSG